VPSAKTNTNAALGRHFLLAPYLGKDQQEKVIPKEPPATEESGFNHFTHGIREGATGQILQSAGLPQDDI
jgi:hypothetical protein